MRSVILWKSVLTLVLFCSFFFLPSRNDFEYTQFSLIIREETELIPQLFGSWANFDGVHYLQIANEGYTDQGRFLPLFPLVLSLTRLISNSYSNYQLLTAQLLALAFTVIFFSLLQKLKNHNKTNTQYLVSNIYLFFPTSFFLLTIYSESLFLLLATSCFYFSQKKLWFLAGLMASLASITRLTGFVLWIIPVITFLEQNNITLKQVFSLRIVTRLIRKFYYFCLLPMPLLAYSYFNKVKWGDWLYFVNAHGNLANSRSTSSLVNPLQTIWRYLRILTELSYTQHEWRIAVLEFLVFVFWIFLIYWAWKMKQRVSYRIYSIAVILIPVLSGTLSGLPRYFLVAFPLFFIMSSIVDKQNKVVKYLIYTVSFSLQLLLFALFSRAYFIA